MAVVFPESMNRLDLSDTEGSLARVENYIRYMTERMEFSNRNMTRSVSSAGLSTVEILQLVQELANAMSAMQSTLNGVQGTLNGLSSSVTNLNSAMMTAQSQISALEGRVTALEEKGEVTT